MRITDEIPLLLWHMHITFQSLLKFVVADHFVVVTVRSCSLFHFLRRKGRRVQQPVAVISLSRCRLSSVCSPPLTQRAPSLLRQPNLSRSLIQDWCHFEWGAGVCLQRGMIMVEADEKPKCRWSLISFEEPYLPLVFCTSLSHDPISLSFKVFPVSRWPLIFSLLDFFHSWVPFHSSFSLPCLIASPNVPSSSFGLFLPLLCDSSTLL